MTKTIEIPLTRGYVTLIDEDDYELVSQYKWYASGRPGYVRPYNQRIGLLYRFLLRPPKGLIVDHINRDSLDNRRSNLRIGTKSQNRINSSRNHGKYLKGVARDPAGGFQARIMKNGKQIYLGYFKTEQEAHEAHVRAAMELYDDWAPTEIRT